MNTARLPPITNGMCQTVQQKTPDVSGVLNWFRGQYLLESSEIMGFWLSCVGGFVGFVSYRCSSRRISFVNVSQTDQSINKETPMPLEFRKKSDGTIRDWWYGPLRGERETLLRQPRCENHWQAARVALTHGRRGHCL